MNHIYEAMLLMVSGIGRAKLTRLIEYFGDAQIAWTATKQDLAESGLLGIKEVIALDTLRNRMDVAETVKHWRQMGISVCGLQDENYPALLRNIFDPPPLLFYRGCLQKWALPVAIVGSRHATPYGKSVARSFGEKLACAGVTIVSGAARGIDTAAHEGALAVGAATVAVLGCGVDVVYPAENSRLFDHMIVNGCILSEYPPGTLPAPGQFPARNRIIAGMSVGVLVVEAAEKSGALITADFSLNENRDVYAIPGSIFSKESCGTHRLIQQGARLVSSAEDLLAELGLDFSGPESRKQEHLDKTEQKVLNEISHTETIPVDSLVIRLDMSAAELVVILLQLEMSGYVVKNAAGYIRSVKE